MDPFAIDSEAGPSRSRYDREDSIGEDLAENESEDERGYRRRDDDDSRYGEDDEDEEPGEQRGPSTGWGDITTETLREIYFPVVQGLISALGGYEEVTLEDGTVERQYRVGDSVTKVLKDLKKLWRRDEYDDFKTVSQIYAETTLVSDLVAIINEVTSRGAWGLKLSIRCIDLLMALTWPVNIPQALTEFQEIANPDSKKPHIDFRLIAKAQLTYKKIILAADIMGCALQTILNPLGKRRFDRDDRDQQEIRLVMFFIRNLLKIRDEDGGDFSSAETQEKEGLQSELLLQLHTSHFLELFQTLASSASTSEFQFLQVELLEIMHLLLLLPPTQLIRDKPITAREKLTELLEKEDLIKMGKTRNIASRHSRFGTTISVVDTASRLGKKTVLHGQGGLNPSTLKYLDTKKKTAPRRSGGGGHGLAKDSKDKQKANTVELGFGASGRETEIKLTWEAQTVLKGFVEEFVETGFNFFFAAMRRAIARESGDFNMELDTIRLMHIATFVIEYFLLYRKVYFPPTASDSPAPSATDKKEWLFGLVGEMTEMDSVRWVSSRIIMFMDETPIPWTALGSGIRCFTQVLSMIDAMNACPDEETREAAEILQDVLYHNGDIMQMSKNVLVNYKPSCTTAYLDSAVELSYVFLRMLERYSSQQSYMFIRKRKAKKKKRANGNGDDDMNEDDDDGRDMPSYAEHQFKFSDFERNFVNPHVLSTLVAHLGRYQDFNTPDMMKRVVGMMHRLAVKEQAEGLFFKASVLHLFNKILEDQATLPRDPSSKDLVSLINFVLRKFFKNAQEKPILIVEAFWPKDTKTWKGWSSYEPPVKEIREKKPSKIPADVQIKDSSLSHSEEVGVAVGVLMEAEQMHCVNWVVGWIKTAAELRRGIQTETDGSPPQQVFDELGEELTDEQIRVEARRIEAGVEGQDFPSEEALAKFIKFDVPYETDDQRTAVTMNSNFKLLLRLTDFIITSDGEIPIQWTIPAHIPPRHLEVSAQLIEQYIRDPLDLNGERASDKLKKKINRKPHKRRSAPDSDPSEPEDTDAVLSDSEAEADRQKQKQERQGRKKKKSKTRVSEGHDSHADKSKRKVSRRREQEEVKYKSAELILDSDESDDEAFFAREKALIAWKTKDDLAKIIAFEQEQDQLLKQRRDDIRRKREAFEAETRKRKEARAANGGSQPTVTKKTIKKRKSNAGTSVATTSSEVDDSDEDRRSTAQSEPKRETNAKTFSKDNGDMSLEEETEDEQEGDEEGKREKEEAPSWSRPRSSTVSTVRSSTPQATEPDSPQAQPTRGIAGRMKPRVKVVADDDDEEEEGGEDDNDSPRKGERSSEAPESSPDKRPSKKKRSRAVFSSDEEMDD